MWLKIRGAKETRENLIFKNSQPLATTAQPCVRKDTNQSVFTSEKMGKAA